MAINPKMDFKNDLDLKKLDRAAELGLVKGLLKAKNTVIEEAVDRAPFDKGDLRMSADGEVSKGANGRYEIWVEFTAAYARRQHEEKDYHHDVGEAKYLENAIDVTKGKRDAEVKEYILRAIRGGYSL